MKKSLTKIIVTSLIILGAVQVSSADYIGTIQCKRDASRSIVGAILITDKKNAQGKTIAYNLVMDENGKAIAQQYENKQVKIAGTNKSGQLTASEWKEVKDTSYGSSSSYNDSYSSQKEESYNDSEEEEEEKNKKSKSSSKNKSKKKSSDDEDEPEENEEEEESDSDNDDSEEEEKQEDEEKSEDDD